MPSLAKAIETYVKAKDENRPHLLSRAFADNATVHMIVDTEAISFPPVMSGLSSITDVLVRQFGQSYENVYTLCLSPPPEYGTTNFVCRWLVGMSHKQDRSVRVGGGLYEWSMPVDRVENLRIKITTMQELDPGTIDPVMRWLAELPYPWCSAAEALDNAPRIGELASVLDHVSSLSIDS